jgi:predicted RNA-binding Zn ribbon-like protein
MSQLASERYGVALAPGGLILTQELLNSISAGRPRLPDLLSTTELAEPWLGQVIAVWEQRTGRTAVPIEAGESRLPRMRTLRAQLQAAAVQDPHDDSPVEMSEISGTVTLTLRGTSPVAASPRGDGLSWLKSTLLLETYLAQQDNTWRRLKICRNPACKVAFYDQSNNNSGVWHNVHVCGNAINLRASRARRRNNEVADPRP